MSVLVHKSWSAFMFQWDLWGLFTTLDNFITTHLVLFILITHAAKYRLRIKTLPEMYSFWAFCFLHFPPLFTALLQF